MSYQSEAGQYSTSLMLCYSEVFTSYQTEVPSKKCSSHFRFFFPVETVTFIDQDLDCH